MSRWSFNNCLNFAIIKLGFFKDFMTKNWFLMFCDRTYLMILFVALATSLFSYYLFQQYFIKNDGIWLAPVFIPIYYFILIIFIINFILSAVSWQRDKFLSYSANGATIFINILLLLAYLLVMINPNG